jgi:arsenate reductase
MGKSTVLFLCTHNSIRSQMAEGLLRHFYGDRCDVFSAGASPTHVHPLAVQVMAETGIDISQQTSKSIEQFRGQNFDLVVTVCRSTPKIACPFCSTPLRGSRPEIVKATLPGAKRYLNHGFNDPSEVKGSEEERLAAFRRTRDEIKQWILKHFAPHETRR